MLCKIFVMLCILTIKEIAKEEIVLRSVDERYVIRLAAVGVKIRAYDTSVREKRKRLSAIFHKLTREHCKLLCLAG